jgi:hypothetical protein
MSQPNEEKNKGLSDSLSFIFRAPYDEEIVAMDCNDYCEELAQIAELVARGASLEEVLPQLEEHMRYWTDCREEFDALVAVLKAQFEDR